MGKPEQAEELRNRLDSIKATSESAARRFSDLEWDATHNPSYFGENETLSNQFWARVQEKASELRQGPELIRKKEEFWRKWKDASLVTATAGVVTGMAGAAWTAKYGFDHTYMVDVLGSAWNGPALAGFAAAVLAEASMGASKFMQTIREKKREWLERNLKSFNV